MKPASDGNQVLPCHFVMGMARRMAMGSSSGDFFLVITETEPRAHKHSTIELYRTQPAFHFLF